MRVAVIGAGIVGASVAYHLSEGGADVVLIDAGEPASGTTSKSFAWTNANNKTPRSYFDLNVAGMEEHVRLRDELGGDWLHETGNGILSDEQGRGELKQRVERLTSWGYAAELMTASEANAKLEPGVVFPDSDALVAHFPEEAWTDAPRLTHALVGRARENGAEVRFGSGAREIDAGGEHVKPRMENGSSIEADAVVNAAGSGADAVAKMVGRTLPLDVFPGLLVRVAVEGEPLRHLLHTPTINLRPDGPGHVLLHHDSVDGKLTDEFVGTEGPLREELLERARRLVPALERASVVEARFGRRPVPGDGYSCVGAISSIPGYYEAVTHSGVTLGPLVGRLLAREILAGEVDPLLAPFRPERFSG